MITSTARGYNPHFDKGYAAVKQIVDKYHDELEYLEFDAGELVDEYGDAYQTYPRIRISFK
jgi:hypothetical protein